MLMRLWRKRVLVHCRQMCKYTAASKANKWSFLKKLKTGLLYNAAVPLLDIYLKKAKTLIQRLICTLYLSQYYSHLAKLWNQHMS